MIGKYPQFTGKNGTGVGQAAARFTLISSLLASAVCSGIVAPAMAREAPRAAAERDAELDRVLTRTAVASLQRVPLVDGQARSRRVHASMDIRSGVITLELDSSFLPADYGPSFEDQQSLIDNALIHVAEKVAPVRRVDYRFDGRDIYDYFPEIKAEDDAAREEGERRRKA